MWLEVRRVLLRGGGVWDTDTATAHWALGAAASLDSALLNGGNGAVSFGDRKSTRLNSSHITISYAVLWVKKCTLTANFADGTTASATVTVPVIPTITSVTPSTGAPGTSPTATVAGARLQAGPSSGHGTGT